MLPSNPKLLFACGLFAAVVAWLLWPVADGTTWREEVEAEERIARLLDRAGPNSPELVAEALRILDPDGVLAESVVIEESLLRLSQDGTTVELPWAHPAPSSVAEAARALELPKGNPEEVPKPLKGLTILLDPGHHGGAWSRIERRHFPVWAEPDTVDGEPSVFVTSSETEAPPEQTTLRIGTIREGDLNWATARLLEEMLVSAGATVHLTRGLPPSESFPEGALASFDPVEEALLRLFERDRDDPSLRWATLLLPTRLAHLAFERRARLIAQEDHYELYSRWDLRRRAAMARDVGADLTLSIHYNFGQKREINHVIIFMTGQKPEDELASPSAVHHALARIAEGDLPVTIEIGRRIGRAMHEGLALTAPPPFAAPPDPRPLWWPVDEQARLFARNLALTRRAAGPVLLLEGPFMNHPPETLRLLREDLEVDGELYPARTREYAEAVWRAVEESAPLLRERRLRREAFSRATAVTTIGPSVEVEIPTR